jgi:hypothetical protein
MREKSAQSNCYEFVDYSTSVGQRMHRNDWIIVCWTISALFELRKRHWIDAS